MYTNSKVKLLDIHSTCRYLVLIIWFTFKASQFTSVKILHFKISISLCICSFISVGIYKMNWASKKRDYVKNVKKHMVVKLTTKGEFYLLMKTIVTKGVYVSKKTLCDWRVINNSIPQMTNDQHLQSLRLDQHWIWQMKISHFVQANYEELLSPYF